MVCAPCLLIKKPSHAKVGQFLGSKVQPFIPVGLHILSGFVPGTENSRTEPDFPAYLVTWAYKRTPSACWISIEKATWKKTLVIKRLFIYHTVLRDNRLIDIPSQNLMVLMIINIEKGMPSPCNIGNRQTESYNGHAECSKI